jgi:hypothetical protein
MLIGAVGIAGAYIFYTVLFPGDAPATAPRKARVVVKKTTGETDYLLSDYTYKIAPLGDNVTPKDAFKPLIVKSTGLTNGTLSIDNFTYSGMATINSETDGLLENSQTGAGDFVKQGDKWHDTWLVVSITPDQIQLRNDGGDITTLVAGAAAAKAASNSAASPAVNNTPVNIVGAIGGPDLTVQPDPTQTGRRGRRGGRNRGGGGGGGNPGDGG